MARLIFEAEAVRRVVEHSLSAPKQREETTGYDPKTFKSITKPVDAPAVVLVHDDGVYLMSNGEPRDIGEGERSFVAYAKGCNPQKDANHWDRSRDLVGGDDFAETLPWARQIKEMLDRGARQIVVNIGRKSLSLSQH
jgi:hypothetical protein